jgi:hypothetical protein
VAAAHHTAAAGVAGDFVALLRAQLEATAASLAQLQEEHAELTHVLIEAKVSIAEKEGVCVCVCLRACAAVLRSATNACTSRAALWRSAHAPPGPLRSPLFVAPYVQASC